MSQILTTTTKLDAVIAAENFCAEAMLFPMGALYITPGAFGVMLSANRLPWGLLVAHGSGLWGDVCPEDSRANVRAIAGRGRILSAYMVGDVRVWVITEADRSSTTILLPSEY